MAPPMLVCPRTGHAARSPGEQDRDGGNRQQHADHGERVTEAHDKRLPSDDPADLHDRLVLCGRSISHAMREEIAG